MYHLISQNGDILYDQKEWVVDIEEDIKYLPSGSGMGSTVFVIENSKIFIMNGNNQWVELK